MSKDTTKDSESTVADPAEQAGICRYRPPEQMTVSNAISMIEDHRAALCFLADFPDPEKARRFQTGLRNTRMYRTLRAFTDSWVDRRIASGGGVGELIAVADAVMLAAHSILKASQEVVPPGLADEKALREGFSGQTWDENIAASAARYVRWLQAGGADSTPSAGPVTVRSGSLLVNLTMPPEFVPFVKALQARNEPAMVWQGSDALRRLIDVEGAFARRESRQPDGKERRASPKLGPYAEGCFRFEGSETAGIPKKLWGLLRSLWNAETSAPFDNRPVAEVWAEVYGKGAYKRATLRRIVNRVNDLFAKTALEVEFTAAGGDQMRLRINK